MIRDRKILFILIVFGMLMTAIFVHSNTEKNQLPGVSKNIYTGLPKEIISKDGTPMILIPAVEFQMGDDSGEDDERPAHKVYVDAFYIDKYEVTNAQYRRFAQETGRREPVGYGPVGRGYGDGFKPWSDKNFNADDKPVVCVTWKDAEAYAKWAGKRLPTEAEWEKSARGGLVSRKYSWGDNWPPPEGAGNFSDESCKGITPKWTYIPTYRDNYTYTAPVHSSKPNGYGLYNMAGNVWEWCADWWDREYYAKSFAHNPIGPALGKVRILRGGGWYDFSDNKLRVANRLYSAPDFTTDHFGFRCAVSVTP